MSQRKLHLPRAYVQTTNSRSYTYGICGRVIVGGEPGNPETVTCRRCISMAVGGRCRHYAWALPLDDTRPGLVGSYQLWRWSGGTY